MAEIMTCTCGQALDITGFAVGQSVRCPRCQGVLKVGQGPASVAASPAPKAPQAPAPATGQSPTAPPMAMAMGAEDSDEVAPAPRPSRGVTPSKRRAQTDQKVVQAHTARLGKVLMWPSLVLGFLSLVAPFALLIYQMNVPQTMKVKVDKDGIEHYFAEVLKGGTKDQFELIEIKPDLMPGDKVEYDAEDNPVITLEGEPLQYKKGILQIKLGGKLISVERRGWWYYEIDPEGKNKPHKVDLPVAAQVKVPGDGDETRYAAVKVVGTDFFDRASGRPVDVAFYKAEEEFLTNPLTIKTHRSDSFFQKVPVWWFIVAGVPIGLFLLAMGVFFMYHSYLSAAAKAARQSAPPA